ncbi:acyl-CoA dehydrogenase family protein [Ottowia sp. VDI28]|uniref:acyl-CoA dehydrogenase family protein n=1 Tax=Ottowia sp. VDI28 TaxID=3133968 RepID=UPI003C2B0496
MVQIPGQSVSEAEFRQQVRDYCNNELPREVRAKVLANLFLTKEDNLAFLRSLARRGWTAGHWPVAYGGAAWTPLQRFVFEEESMRHGAPWLIPFGINYVGPVIYTFGSEAQKQRFLPHPGFEGMVGARLFRTWCGLRPRRPENQGCAIG